MIILNTCKINLHFSPHQLLHSSEEKLLYYSLQEEEDNKIDWRVPPHDWTGQYDNSQYWNCLAAAGLYVTSQVNKTKQRPKKFRCPHCDVAFSNNGQLKGHVRIHTGKFYQLLYF